MADSRLEYSQLRNPPTLPTVTSVDYNFTPKGGNNLIIGGNNITLNPMPKGLVSGNSLRITGGVGTSEIVPITAVGANSVSVTCANTHTGNWVIQSASSGIQEAAAIVNNYVYIPQANYDVFATITPASGVTIDGLGMPSATGLNGAANLNMRTAGKPCIDIKTSCVSLKNLQVIFGQAPTWLVNGVPATVGSIGIQTGVNGTVDQPILENVIAIGFYNNFKFSTGAIYCDKVDALSSVQDGFIIGALGSGYMLNTLSENSGGNGYTILTGCAAIQWEDIAGFANHGWGMFINDSVAFQMDDLDFEDDTLGGISIGVSAVNSIIQNVIIQFEGIANPFGGGTNNAAPGIQLRTNGFVIISNAQISACTGNGIEMLAGLGAGIQVNGGTLYQNGSGGQANSKYNLYCLGINSTFNDITIQDAQVFINAANCSFLNNHFSTVVLPSVAGINFGALCTDLLFDKNSIQMLNAGVAVNYTAGCTLLAWGNNIIFGGTVSGTPVRSANSVLNLPFLTTPLVAFASLPAPGVNTRGGLAFVIDSTVNTWGSTITGGGGFAVLAFCDGTNWTVAGK